MSDGLLIDVRHSAAATEHVCHGPGADGRCPLLDGRHCDLFDRADGIVFGLDLDDATNRAVLARYRELRPDLPVHVIASPEAAERWADVVAGLDVVTSERKIAALLTRVENGERQA
jgi:hypothetical protein